MNNRVASGAARFCLAALTGGLLFSTALAEPPGRTSPFGVGSCHIHNRTASDNERWIPEMRAIGLTAYRTPACNWGALEPSPGVWEWRKLDAQMDYLDSQGMVYGCLLLGNPSWNKADPPGHLPSNNVEGWSNYVTNLARHVRGRTDRFEIWNEPPNFTGKTQTPADYAKLVVAAYDAAKAVHPSIKIGLAAKSVHVAYLEQTIAAGAKDHFDYIVLHPYEVLDSIVSDAGGEQIFAHIPTTVRTMLAARNPSKADVPIVYTELGVSAKKGLGPQANALVKAYTLGIASGVECLEWFEGRDGDSGPLGLLDRQGLPRPAYFALGQMVSHLGQHPEYLGWTRLEGGGLAFGFQGPREVVAVAWAPGGAKPNVQTHGELRVVHPPTGAVRRVTKLRLGVAPVFVLTPPRSWVDAMSSNRGRPLDSGVDYSQAKEVSIEFGKQVVSRGLRTLSGGRLAEAVVAYGGSARAGDVPGGSAFVVDPGFLCFHPAKIEITAEVRRNPSNDNAGFKLVYESPQGFSVAGGWYTVPDNKKWHTARWVIDDPQFVNYWGYNFLLQSDGNVFNKYLIRRVRVRKID